MKMKSIYVFLVCSLPVLNSFAQEAEKDKDTDIKKTFKKENLFTGGTLNVSFFNGTTALGISPFFGYSINKYVDVAASMSVNYISQRDYNSIGDKLRQTILGPGAFVRLFPVKFLFAQAQYEHNFIKLKYIPASNGTYLPSTNKIDANSVLVGGGYTSGRGDGTNTFYYLSIMWDVSRVAESPYVDGLGRNFPIIKAGYNIGLFQGKRR